MGLQPRSTGAYLLLRQALRLSLHVCVSPNGVSQYLDPLWQARSLSVWWHWMLTLLSFPHRKATVQIKSPCLGQKLLSYSGRVYFYVPQFFFLFFLISVLSLSAIISHLESRALVQYIYIFFRCEWLFTWVFLWKDTGWNFLFWHTTDILVHCVLIIEINVFMHISKFFWIFKGPCVMIACSNHA